MSGVAGRRTPTPEGKGASMDVRGNPSITLRQLWHFVTAAEAGTISEAAKRLRMAPSAISMSLAELERMAGTQLAVKRKAHGLTLTAAGRAAYAQAREILDLADEIVHLGGDGLRAVRGPLAVGCYMPLAPAVIPQMLRAFAEECPEVDVNFVEGYHDDLQQRLVSGAIDVAFLYNAALEPEIRTAPLLEVPPYLLLAEEHPLARVDEVRLEALDGEPFVLFDAAPISTRVLELLGDHGISPAIRHRSRSYATVRSLVGAGMGFSVLYQRPELDLSYLGLGVVAKPIAEAEDRRPPRVSLAWSCQVRPSARARAWLDVALATFATGEEPRRAGPVEPTRT